MEPSPSLDTCVPVLVVECQSTRRPSSVMNLLTTFVPYRCISDLLLTARQIIQRYSAALHQMEETFQNTLSRRRITHSVPNAVEYLHRQNCARRTAAEPCRTRLARIHRDSTHTRLTRETKEAVVYPRNAWLTAAPAPT